MKIKNIASLFVFLLFVIITHGQDNFILEEATTPRFNLTDKIWEQNIGDASVSLWNDDKLSAFSITIDDNYENDIPFWIEQQKIFSFNFTWFVITEAEQKYNVKNWALFNELAKTGNAIQGHDDRNWYEDKAKGINFPSIKNYNNRLNRTISKIEKNIDNQKCLTYAYPWGEGNENEAGKHFIASRGVIGRLNNANQINFKQVRSISNPHIYENDSTRNHYILPLLDKTSTLENKNYYRGWGSTHFHEVSALDSQKKTVEFLNYLKEKEDKLWIGTFPDIAKYAQEYATHSIHVDSVSETQIHITLKDEMRDDIYDYPLTVKVRLANNWISLYASQSGSEIASEIIEYNNNNYALIKAVPDSGQIILKGKIDHTISENSNQMRFELTTLKDEYYIPTAISNEAKEILKKRGRFAKNGARLPDPDAPIKEWTDYQNGLESRVLKAIEPIKLYYKPSIDTITIGGIRAIDIKPKGYKKNNKVIVYVHGGGYVSLSADATLASMLPLADISGLRIIAIDYTLAPQAKFKIITNEVIQFYQALLKQYNAENIAFYGDSAGGGLASGSILKMRDLNLPLPSSLVLWSPWLDLAKVGDSHYTLADNDPSLKYSNLLEYAALAYAPESEFKNPYVSPVYGDYSKNFPPTLIQVGSKEILLSDAIRMYRTLDDHDIETKLDVYEGMWHVWQGYYLTPESKTAVKNTNKFILKHLK
ncbi:alpha/beta hydrolase fold domain-containing protein [Maribacter sp.]|uniref:alpha/beta hydrolase fold domain-containing protein n=1 Tax=Maribacter sp. TaxID=1897614 RepID=UPI0032999C03